MKFSLLLALFWPDDVAKAVETVLGCEKQRADAHYCREACREATQEWRLVFCEHSRLALTAGQPIWLGAMGPLPSPLCTCS